MFCQGEKKTESKTTQRSRFVAFRLIQKTINDKGLFDIYI